MPMIRVSDSSHQTLKFLAAQKKQPMQSVIENAIETLRRQAMLEEANAAFQALKRDPQAWQEELAERALWEQTLLDGVDAE